MEWLALVAGMFFSVNAVPPITPQVTALEAPPLSVQVELQALASEEPTTTCLSCIVYLREKWGIPVRGDALFVFPNTPMSEAEKNDIVIFQYGRGADKAHVARLDKITNQGIEIDESITFQGECIVRHRVVSFNDPALMGFAKVGKLLPISLASL